MVIVVFNSGSSSLKFKLYDLAEGGDLQPRGHGTFSAFGGSARWTWRMHGATQSGSAEATTHGEAARWVLRRLQDQSEAITAVGHRVVHGGAVFRSPALLTDTTLARLDALSALAPLHNPRALDVIRACRATLGKAVPMVATFDTAFFADLPEAARDYALPRSWVRDYHIRRYGFHGLAHYDMYARYCTLHPDTNAHGRVITFQLGNGCSVSALRSGAPIDTSMGYTPLEGLIMSTRPGDVDAGVLVELIANGVSPADLEAGLNHAAGLLGLSDTSGDMRELLALETNGHAGASHAIEAFCHRARRYLGAYLVLLGGADAVIFGGGIGEHAPTIRARICADTQWCGLQLDTAANLAAKGDTCISTPASTVRAYVVAVDEERLIAHATIEALRSR